MENSLDIGNTIRSKRKSLDLTQQELAGAANTGLRFIVDLEKGKPTCEIGKVLQVLKALGLEIKIDNA